MASRGLPKKRSRFWKFFSQIILSLLVVVYFFILQSNYGKLQIDERNETKAEIYKEPLSNWKNMTSNPKLILLWSTMFLTRSLDAWQRNAELPRYNHSCEFECNFSVNISELENSDAVIYHGYPELQGMYPLPRSNYRNSQQVWVYLTREPPLIHDHIYDTLNDSCEFNWTMTYRTDSDIYFPYGRLIKATTVSSAGDMDFIKQKAYSRSNHSLAAAMISNCNRPSRRDEYIHQLSKVITIDIYGSCGNLKCDEDVIGAPRKLGNCYKKLVPKYKFWLSFENSLCLDYVTEKLYYPLKYGSLPVYLGYPDVKYLPNQSYIHTKDFKTVEELGKYLLHLDAYPKEYLKYFEWRKKSRVTVMLDEEDSTAWCTLCRKLHEIDEIKPRNHKCYKRVADWFLRNNTQEKVCKLSFNSLSSLIK